MNIQDFESRLNWVSDWKQLIYVGEIRTSLMEIEMYLQRFAILAAKTTCIVLVSSPF